MKSPGSFHRPPLFAHTAVSRHVRMRVPELPVRFLGFWLFGVGTIPALRPRPESPLLSKEDPFAKSDQLGLTFAVG